MLTDAFLINEALPQVLLILGGWSLFHTEWWWEDLEKQICMQILKKKERKYLGATTSFIITENESLFIHL